MLNKSRVLFLFVAFFAFTSIAGAEALHPFFEQNGDCYLMIGEGSARAVWALNNLSGGVPSSLYDPYDAYGLTAAQSWNAATKSSEKDLFTFSGDKKDVKVKSLKGKRVPRRIIVHATRNLHGFDQIPAGTVHRFHSWPDSSPTGRGNHSQRVANSLFGGTCYPCTKIPDAVATMPGYYWYPVGEGFYHDADAVVWSNWTYGSSGRARQEDGSKFTARRSAKNPPTEAESFNPRGRGGMKPPRGPWIVCCSGNRPQNGWVRGGWVRRVRRENLWGSFRDLKLFEYRIGSGDSAPSMRANVASVLAKVTGTYDLNGECCDGCIRRVNGVAMPGVPSPHLASDYSPVVDRSYLYRRDYDSDIFTLQGATDDDTIVGDGSDLTCEFLGISSKSESGNYVYLLGLNQINQWLAEANATDAMYLKELTDVAVSDQWWQTGGIVYAYDKSKGMVYRFVRNENGENDTPGEISVTADGIVPDNIGADGFGNLYVMRTEYEPVDVSTFAPGQEKKTYLVGSAAGGFESYRAEFEQKVYKSVFMRDYYTGILTQVPGKILIGKNNYYRDFTASDISDYSTWLWAMSAPEQLAPVIDDKIRTELAVINSPTPPRPGNLEALTDNLGPMLSCDEGFEFAEPADDGFFPDSQDYWFLVENAPNFDINDINKGNLGKDLNNNSRIGKFPNTIQRSSISYQWKVIQTHDRFDELLLTPNVILDMQSEGMSGDYLFLFPPAAGRFKVGVRVTYRYYDFRDLPVNAMANQKGDVLKPPLDQPPLVAAGEDANGYSWSEIKIKTVPQLVLPENSGVIMSGIVNPAGGMKSALRPGPSVLGFGCANAGWGNESCGHVHCNPAVDELPPTKFIIDGTSLVPQASIEGSDWSVTYSDAAEQWILELRDSNQNLNSGVNRIASMTSEEPPIPNDPGLITTSPITWAGDPVVTWSSKLMRGADTIIDKQIVTASPRLDLDQLRILFPIPSEPASYTLNVDFARTYRYEIYMPVWRNVGGELKKEHVPVPRVVNMKIWSEAEILVTDNTGPALFLPNPLGGENAISPAYLMTTNLLYGTTGESLSLTQSPPGANPSFLSFIVADNNPMANSTFTNTGSDQYHSGVAGVGSRLKVNFKPDNHAASFSYTIHGGVMPPDTATPNTAELALQNRYKSGSKVTVENINGEDNFNAITSTSGLFNRTFSYKAYTIKVADLAHFSRKLQIDNFGAWDYVGAWTSEMHPTRATNLEGYSNLTFGLAWNEACHSSSNPLAIGPQRQGQIVVRDNDRPNIFITARQDKYPSELFRTPTNISENVLPPRWLRLTTSGMNQHINNGPESWTLADMSSFFHARYYKDIGQPISNDLFGDLPLEVNVPVRFDLICSDNTGTVATVTYQLLDAEDNVIIDGTFAGSLPMQYVFREPGDYSVKATIEDRATSWPSNPMAYAPGADSSEDPGINNKFNRRTLTAKFTVVSTRLELRIIEQKRQAR